MPQTLKSLAEFQRVSEIYSEDTIVIDYSATWCGHCKRIAPHYDKLESVIMTELGETEKVLFYKVDVDVAKDLAKYHNVKCMPTFKFCKGGQVVDTLKGANVKKLVEITKRHLVKKIDTVIDDSVIDDTTDNS